MSNGAETEEKPARSGWSDELKRELAEVHAYNVSTSKRAKDIIGIVGWICVMTYLSVTLLRYRETATPIGTAIAVFLGVMAGDLASGIVHWMIDTWGDHNTPFIGKMAILLFQEHHVAPQAITHSDFLRIWGDPCICMTGIMLSLLLVQIITPNIMTYHAVYHSYIFLFMISCCIASYSQIHKWAHVSNHRLPAAVQWLQKWHIIVSREHHHFHHTPPHNKRYCSVTGLANYPLDYFKVWRGLEWVVEHLMNVKARDPNRFK